MKFTCEDFTAEIDIISLMKDYNLSIVKKYPYTIINLPIVLLSHREQLNFSINYLKEYKIPLEKILEGDYDDLAYDIIESLSMNSFYYLIFINQENDDIFCCVHYEKLTDDKYKELQDQINADIKDNCVEEYVAKAVVNKSERVLLKSII